jgi:hypothetical protein
MANERSEGSGRSVDDFSSFREGDIDPTLNKSIKTLIDSNVSYPVYLDEDLYAEWTFNGGSPDGFDSTANKIGHLETLSLAQLSSAQREPFERLLAEAMARILGDHSEEKATVALDAAEAYLKARGSENARRWYLQGVGVATVCALTVAGILMTLLSRVSDPGWRDALEVLSAAAMGALGAFLSVASRTETIHFEPVAGPVIHKFEGATRAIVGMAGALFIALAIKADLLLGVFHSVTHPFLALLAACVVGGATERLVPGLINNMAKSLSKHGK